MLHYDTRGTGSAHLLLLHGFLGSGRNLASLARRLSEERPDLTVVMPDLRGHGVSPSLTPDASLELLARDVLELGQSLSGGKPFELVGHSLGGRVALVASHLQPEAISRTVLLDIGPTPFVVLQGAMQRIFERLMGAPMTLPSRPAMREFFLSGGVTAPLADWILTNFVATPEGFAWRIDRAALAAFHWAEAEVDLWPMVPPLAHKLEVLYGGASAFVSPAMRAKLQEAGVHVAELVGASHFVHVDALEDVVARLATAPTR
jgi:pimeloyl-ACP methyl ester carboxylesterase